MDTTITSDAPASGTAETATPEQASGTGNAAPETNGPEGGEPQGSAEGSQEQTGGRRRWSMQDEIKELRAQRREWRNSEAERETRYSQIQEELRQLRESIQRQGPNGTAKTPANFWQDPEGTLNSALDERLERLQNNMQERFEMTREQEFARQAHAQEVASSTEFIRAQKGYDAADDEELIEIIEAIPKRTRDGSDPQTIAEYAWMKLQAQRGIGDKSLQKQRASGVQGQPPGVGFGRKIWSRQEFDAACDMLSKSSKSATDPKNAELLAELESANKEGRVR